MRRTHIIIVLALAASVPAAFAGANALLAPDRDGLCFSAGASAYRLTTRAKADFTIRIDNAAARPDLTVQIVDNPAAADFVLLDESGQPRDCHLARTIRLDASAAEPDLTIAISRDEDEGRIRIYAEAPAFRAEDAAALFAVMRKAPRKRVAAAVAR
jgi:hypothetical protein